MGQSQTERQRQRHASDRDRDRRQRLYCFTTALLMRQRHAFFSVCVSVGEPDGGVICLSSPFFFLQNMSDSSYELEKTRKAVAAKDLELASCKVPRHFFFLPTTALRQQFFFFVGNIPRT